MKFKRTSVRGHVLLRPPVILLSMTPRQSTTELVMNYSYVSTYPLEIPDRITALAANRELASMQVEETFHVNLNALEFATTSVQTDAI